MLSSASHHIGFHHITPVPFQHLLHKTLYVSLYVFVYFQFKLLQSHHAFSSDFAEIEGDNRFGVKDLHRLKCPIGELHLNGSNVV